MISDDDEQTEMDRLEALAKWQAEHAGDPDFTDPARWAPGSVGCHEALHTAYLVQEMISAHLMSHPTVLHDPELYRAAWASFDAVYDLYNAIGKDHLGGPPDKADVGDDSDPK